MVQNLTGAFGAGLVGVAVATSALADDMNVTTAVDSMKIGGEFRSELIYKDHGLQKKSGVDPKSTSVFEVQAAKIKLAGNLNKDTEFKFRFNLLQASSSESLEYGFGTHWFSKTVGFSVGKQKIVQGGFDNIDGNFKVHASGAYRKNLPVGEYLPMFALNLNLAGSLQVQVFNDVVDEPTSQRWSHRAHPTFAIGWRGSFGPITPLFNFGSYDNNHSRWIDVGVKTEMAGLTAQLDVNLKSQVNRVLVAGEKDAKKVADDATSVSLHVGYTMAGVAMPWFYYSHFDNKQGENKAAKLEDLKFNSIDPTKTGDDAYLMKDNGQTIGLGANLLALGKGWTPYLAVVRQAGKWEDEKKAGKAKEKSQLVARLGVFADI